MSKKNFLADLAAQLSEALPKEVGTLKKDMEQTCHHLLMNAFAKLEIVTREEFDVQTKVLARSRQKLEALEKKVHELEALLKKKSR